MKLGTIVELPDKRIGTVVYNSLIGVGIKWGIHYPDPQDFIGTDGNTVSDGCPEGWQWEPDALLRDPWPSCEVCGFMAEQCVGEKYEIITKDGESSHFRSKDGETDESHDAR